MKHPIEDHSFFGIDVIEELVEEFFQLSNNNEDMEAFAGSIEENSCLGVAGEETDPEEVQDLPNSKDDHSDIADLDFEIELSELLNQGPKSCQHTWCRVEIKSAKRIRA
ncbi:hypothetical protein CR513_45915, partial [Mucuna pruriens]